MTTLALYALLMVAVLALYAVIGWWVARCIEERERGEWWLP